MFNIYLIVASHILLPHNNVFALYFSWGGDINYCFDIFKIDQHVCMTTTEAPVLMLSPLQSKNYDLMKVIVLN